MKRNPLKILFIYNGIFVFAGNLIGPLYALYLERFPSSGILTISASWAVFLVSTTLFMYIISKVGDRVKEKEYLLIAGYLVRAIAWFLFILISKIEILIALQILLGLGEALGTPAFDAIFATHLKEGSYMSTYSNWKLITNFVLALGTLLGGFIVSVWGFNPLFLIMSFLAFLSFFGILLKPRNLL